MKYAYLLLALSVAAQVAYILWCRRDLARAVIKLAIFGGVAGWLAELAYMHDYWHPPVIGWGTITLEDFMFGFSISALSVTLYPWMFGRKFGDVVLPKRRRQYLCFIAASVVAIIVFNLVLGINSIFVTSAIFLFAALAIIAQRSDLLRPALVTALIMTGMFVMVYILIFDLLAPEFWNKYWALKSTKWGVIILGHVPLTELLWYFTWGLLGSVSYPFISGRQHVYTKKHD